MVDDDRTARERYGARVRGCLLGGAIGDALGAPVEFWSRERIWEQVGPDGVREYLPDEEGSGYGQVTDDTQTVELLGQGWVAEEALAIAVYAALAHPGPGEMLDALTLSVTHSGDSDSTGSICGNILGALHGDTALPPVLAFEVEGRATILQLADDFVWEFTQHRQLHGDHGPVTRWTTRY